MATAKVLAILVTWGTYKGKKKVGNGMSEGIVTENHICRRKRDMGQLYKIVNVDKEEMLVPWDFSNGAKLMEWSYNNNDMILALFNLLAGEWKGDRVFVIGDYADLGYADLGNPNEPCHEALRKVLEEKMICDLYGYASKNYRNISGESDVSEYGYRYIYNHALKVVIDLDKCPIERTFWSKVEKEVCIVRISPLSLLLAIGNGRGGGDFHEGNNGYEYVGSWCDTVSDIEVTIEPLDGIDYEEFSPDFTENNPMIPYTNLADEIKKCEEKVKELQKMIEIYGV